MSTTTGSTQAVATTLKPNLEQYRDYVQRCGYYYPTLNAALNTLLNNIKDRTIQDSYVFNSELGAFVRSMMEATAHFHAAVEALTKP